MKKYLDEDFLLNNSVAKQLYHEYGEKKSIYDFHCHLSPSEIAENKSFDNISSLWLGTGTFGDHYKWRAMRANGLTEQADSPWEKFYNWAKTMESLYFNPLFDWTNLELRRVFSIDEVLTAGNAKKIYEECNRQLQTKADLTVYGILKKFNVYAIGTTDDPSDSLEYHFIIKNSECPAKVFPTFRPDRVLNINQVSFASYISKLGDSAKIKIKSVEDVLQALENRLDFFVCAGCKATDHALEDVPFAPAGFSEVNSIFLKAVNGEKCTKEDEEKYRYFILRSLGEFYAKRSLVMQLHIGAIRNINSKKFRSLGFDTGYDAVGNCVNAKKLSLFLDSLEINSLLPKTILYSLNPNDYCVLATIMGCFQEKGIKGKMQLGSAWWFCDHKDGIEEQLKTLGNLGLLSSFVGMLTDSRSFLSYTRHEYFRRILCNLIGNQVENGNLPYNKELLGKMTEDICFDNALSYFGS